MSLEHMISICSFVHVFYFMLGAYISECIVASSEGGIKFCCEYSLISFCKTISCLSNYQVIYVFSLKKHVTENVFN